MELSAGDQVGLYLFERDAFFMLPRPGNQHVLDVLPQCPVFLEVDYGRRLAAFRVSDELNSGHGRVSLCGVEPVLTLIAMPRPVNRLARPSQFEGLTGAKPFRISEGYPRVFTTEKGGGDLFWRDLGGLDPGRRLRGECDPSLVQ